MFDIIAKKSVIDGSFYAPPSKSEAHRALICASLCDDATRISNIGTSNDIKATKSVLCALCAKITEADENGENKSVTAVFCRAQKKGRASACESASTLRFLIPVAAALGSEFEFLLEGSLKKRPLDNYLCELHRHGVSFARSENSLSVSGKLRSGVYNIDSEISSQYVSGLLFALPLLSGDSEIHTAKTANSSPYIDMTVDILGKFGIVIEKTDHGYFIKGDQKYKSPNTISVGGDYSGSANLLSLGIIDDNRVTCKGLFKNSLQGDIAVLDVLRKFGASVSVFEDTIEVCPHLHRGIDIDVSKTPDLAMLCAVLAATAEGKSRIVGTKRLKYKESDRAKNIVDMLKLLGADITLCGDEIDVCGVPKLHGGCVDSFGDHRLLMALVVASQFADGDVTIKNGDCITKSYPDFLCDFSSLGGDFLAIKRNEGTV